MAAGRGRNNNGKINNYFAAGFWTRRPVGPAGRPNQAGSAHERYRKRYYKRYYKRYCKKYHKRYYKIYYKRYYKKYYKSNYKIRNKT